MESQLTKAELIERIEAAWTGLNETLSGLSEAQLTRPGPDGGWSIKDHLAHLAVWEQGIVALLRGEPRWAAMGVDEATAAEVDMDGLNDVLVRQNRERSLAEVLAAFREAHQQMLAVLAELDQADLYRSYAHYQPGGSSEPVIGWIRGDSYEHYLEHLPWIEAIIKTSGDLSF